MWWELQITNLLIIRFFQLPVTSFLSHLNMYFTQDIYIYIYHPAKSKSPLMLTSTCHALAIHKPTTKPGLNAKVVVLTPDSNPGSPRLYSWHLLQPVCRRITARQTPGAPWNYARPVTSTTPTTEHNHPSTRHYITYTAGKAFLKKYTRAAPKVMPPIYFHGNSNRYKEHNNKIW